MESQLNELSRAISQIYSGWILWNLFLAFIPLVLSFWLFRRRRVARAWQWWILLVVYIAFLPNAPYLLTDIIHLIRGIRNGFSAYIIALFFFPLHIASILLGFEAYVVSVINQGEYLKRLSLRHLILPMELITHALCAVGVFIGRFRRYNSWDLVTDPDTVLLQTLDDLTSKRPLFVIFVTFLIFTVLYWLAKQITLGLVLRIRYARSGREISL